MMRREEEQFEEYLAEFEPRGVRALAAARRTHNLWVRRLLAAAAVVCCAGASAWEFNRYRTTDQRAEVKSQTLFLTKIGLENGKKLDALLDEQSRNVLPDLEGERSTLRVLAKE